MTFLLSLGLLYLAYRIIRNGFLRPQSEKLNGFGIVGIVVMGYLALYFVISLID